MQHLTQRWGSLQVTANQSESFVKQMAGMVGGQSDLKYPGHLGLLAAFGKRYAPATPSERDKVERGDMGECFRNAGNIAIEGTYTYVEGYAIGAYIPMQHGWLTLDKRTAIDPTWQDGTDYFGIAFTTSFLRKRLQQTGIWGVMAMEFPDDEMIRWFSEGFPAGALA